MLKKLLFLSLLFVVIISNAQNKKIKSYELVSPSGVNKIQFEMIRNTPKYSVSHKENQVITPSDMGFVLKEKEDLSSNFEIKKVKHSTFDETWKQVWGEKKQIRNHYNQMVIQLQQKEGNKRKLELWFRAFDDGIAFRYVYPKQQSKDSIFIMDEKTTFNLKEDGAAWWIPAYKENRYEYLYTKSAVSTLDTVHTPLTIESNSGLKLSFHEGNLTDFASMTLVNTTGTQL